MLATCPWEAVVHVSHGNSVPHAFRVSLSEKRNNLFEGLHDSKIDTERNQALYVHGVELIRRVNTIQAAPETLQVVLHDDQSNVYFSEVASFHRQSAAQHDGGEVVTEYSLRAPASAPFPPQNRPGSYVQVVVQGKQSDGATMTAYIRFRGPFDHQAVHIVERRNINHLGQYMKSDKYWEMRGWARGIPPSG